MPDPETEELRLEQVRRERFEAAAAQDAPDSLESLAHQRRAEKAAYLKRKLSERAAAEDARERGG